MIIQLESRTAEDVGAAKRSLEDLAHSWGEEITEATTAAVTVHKGDDKIIDPVSIATLLLSIPGAALAVSDLADRIRKRRRAEELIDQAQQLAAQQVTVCVTSESGTVDLSTLTPDQVLDLADEDPAG
jgi:hypothetical protein